MGLILVAAVLAPALGAALAWLRASGAQPVLAATVIGFLLAAVVLVAAVVSDPARATAWGLGLDAGRVEALLLVLVLGVSVVVTAFAGRYMQGDPAASRFFVGIALTTTFTAATVSAATLVSLALAWTLAGAGLCALLATYPQLAAAREGVRRTALSFAIGDAALWIAVGLSTWRWGTVDLRALPARAGDLTGHPVVLGAVAILLVAAAAARSAQLPLQRWLPATLAAPTPVSALLHAGLVNGGGVLLIRLHAIVGLSAAALALAFAAGSLTMVYGSALMLAKPDVKGALAHSTMAQMGFMIATCGLGAFGAALFHLVAHGMYKATLFLGSGGVISARIRHTLAPPSPLRPLPVAARLAVAAAVPALVLAASWAVLHREGGYAPLLVFAWATGAVALWRLLREARSVGGAALATALVAGAVAAYAGLVAGFARLVHGSLAGGTTHAVSAWLVLAPLAALGAGALLVHAAGLPALDRARRNAYVWALGAGHVGERPLGRAA